MSPRKHISLLTPKQAEARRKRDRENKAIYRSTRPPEIDKRGYRDRAKEMREYRKRKKEGL